MIEVISNLRGSLVIKLLSKNAARKDDEGGRFCDRTPIEKNSVLCRRLESLLVNYEDVSIKTKR